MSRNTVCWSLRCKILWRHLAWVVPFFRSRVFPSSLAVGIHPRYAYTPDHPISSLSFGAFLFGKECTTKPTQTERYRSSSSTNVCNLALSNIAANSLGAHIFFLSHPDAVSATLLFRITYSTPDPTNFRIPACGNKTKKRSEIRKSGWWHWDTQAEENARQWCGKCKTQKLVCHRARDELLALPYYLPSTFCGQNRNWKWVRGTLSYSRRHDLARTRYTWLSDNHHPF